MSSTGTSELQRILQPRLDSIVEHWHRAIAQTSYSSLEPAQVRARLAVWAKEILNLLETEPFERSGAAAIGQAIAGLHFLQPEALAQTQEVLSHDLVAGLPPVLAAALQPNLTYLLVELASGFYREARKIILSEQEQVRAALVGELARTAIALQEARDHLEVRVQQRTRELEVLNRELQSEILERVRIAHALRKSENKYRTLLESIHDGIYTLDREGRFTFVNAVIAERSGYPMEWFLGRRYVETVRPEDRDRAQESMDSVLRGEPVPVHQLAYRTASGDVKWSEVNTTALREGERIVGLHGVARDVTERRKIEELKDNLIRDVSHELRTPLAKLCMGLDLLDETLAEKEVDQARASRIGAVVRGNVQRLLRTVEVMLDLSSLESGQIKYTMEIVEPASLVREVVTDMSPLANAGGLALVADLPEDLPPLFADRDKLFRVLVNLVDNAVKFTATGTITVSARESSNELHFSVKDEGLGILSENLGRIFDRFFQEKTRFHGVGVGLAICKSIVEAHGGRIWAESAGRGLGSTIRFTVPIASG